MLAVLSPSSDPHYVGMQIKVFLQGYAWDLAPACSLVEGLRSRVPISPGQFQSLRLLCTPSRYSDCDDANVLGMVPAYLMCFRPLPYSVKVLTLVPSVEVGESLRAVVIIPHLP